MKNSNRVIVAILCVVISFTISCKQKPQNAYAYNPNKDTIPPVLAITVPVNLDTYSYGEDIHIVGTATDLQARDYLRLYAGKMKSLYLTVDVLDVSQGNVIKTIFEKWASVDGKDGYTINEKTYIASGVGPTYCRFKGILTDYADRKDSTEAFFTIN